MSARLAHLACFAAFAAIGCGGDLDPITVASGCPTQPIRGPLEYANEPADRLISDFESGNGNLAAVMGRDGYWIKGDDNTAGSLTAEVSDKCAARGKYAGHFAASGFANWGSNWTASFRRANPTPYDGRAYQGISFFAAFGEGNTRDFAVPLGISTIDTVWNGGVCKYPGPDCMDFYGVEVPFTHEWRRYVVRFDDMTQAGWGIPQTPMKRDKMIGFIIWPDQQFDIWIDDVRFEP